MAAKRIDHRTIEALQRHVDAANQIKMSLENSERRGQFIDPSFDLARDEVIQAAHKLVTWTEDLLFVARTLLPERSPIVAETGGFCQQCGHALAPQSGPGHPRKYCDVKCRERYRTHKRRSAA